MHPLQVQILEIAFPLGIIILDAGDTFKHWNDNIIAKQIHPLLLVQTFQINMWPRRPIFLFILKSNKFQEM